MNKRFLSSHSGHGAPIIRACLLALALCGLAPQSQANQSSASFNVKVDLKTGERTMAGCRTANGIGIFGATVTVKCGSSSPTAASDLYRFLTHVSGHDLSATVDSYAGIGTSTAFRMVRLHGTDYLEMTIGW
jgi:hypothetical protein